MERRDQPRHQFDHLLSGRLRTWSSPVSGVDSKEVPLGMSTSKGGDPATDWRTSALIAESSTDCHTGRFWRWPNRGLSELSPPVSLGSPCAKGALGFLLARVLPRVVN